MIRQSILALSLLAFSGVAIAAPTTGPAAGKTADSDVKPATDSEAPAKGKKAMKVHKAKTTEVKSETKPATGAETHTKTETKTTTETPVGAKAESKKDPKPAAAATDKPAQ